MELPTERPLLRNIDDAYMWSLETVQALRSGDFSRIDMEELIAEIGSIATGLYLELVSILTEIIEAILLMDYTGSDKEAADRQLVSAQGQLQLVLYSSRSLRQAMPEAIQEAYQRAKAHVIEDYRVWLPVQCPIPVDRIIEDPFDRVMAAKDVQQHI